MSENDSTIPRKTCTKCGVEYLATRDYFPVAKGGYYGLAAACKKCNAARAREWARNNRDKNNANKQRWRANHRERYLEKSRGYMRKIYQLRPEQLRKYTRDWLRARPEYVRAHVHKRRARKRSLPNTLTPEQWQYAIEYFNGGCAVCGRQCRDLFKTHSLAMDHWIPLNSPDCPGTTALNCVPLCHGEGGCNNSKHDKDPIEWLVWKFGKRKATIIKKQIQEYFDSLK